MEVSLFLPLFDNSSYNTPVTQTMLFKSPLMVGGGTFSRAKTQQDKDEDDEELQAFLGTTNSQANARLHLPSNSHKNSNKIGAFPTKEKAETQYLSPFRHYRRWILFTIVITTASWVLTIMAAFRCNNISVAWFCHGRCNSSHDEDFRYHEWISTLRYSQCGGGIRIDYRALMPSPKLEYYQPTEIELLTLEKRIEQLFLNAFVYGIVATVVGGMATTSTYYFGVLCFVHKEGSKGRMYFGRKSFCCVMAGYILAGSFLSVMVSKIDRADICSYTEKACHAWCTEAKLTLQNEPVCSSSSWEPDRMWNEGPDAAVLATCLWFICPASLLCYFVITSKKYYYPDPVDLKNCNDKRRLISVLKRNGLLVRHMSRALANDKGIALTVVGRNPDAIKFVHNDLKRDPDVLIAAGMFDENHDATRRGPIKKIVLSTRFALNESSHSEATYFTKLLKNHEYIRRNFIAYSPNAFDKKSCDKNWTDFDHPCRGTRNTCNYNNILADDGRPTDDCCWRFSFRAQLEEANRTGGFMLQLVEPEKQGSPDRLGKGQAIELDMAHNHLKMKVFHVHRPRFFVGDIELQFDDVHLNEVVNVIKRWYSNDCQDMSVTVIRPQLSL